MRAKPIIARTRPLDIPLDQLRSRVGRLPTPTLLGNPESRSASSRWSILAAHPRAIIESADGLSTRLQTGRIWSPIGPDALTALDSFLAENGLDGASNDLDPALPFQGGLIGFLAYDLAPRIEAIPRRLPPCSTLPALRFGLYDTFILVDHDRDRADLWAVDLAREGEPALLDRLDAWSDALRGPIPHPMTSMWLDPVRPAQTPASYRVMIDHARRYIAAGDIFQVNLAQRFATTGKVDPIALDARLQALSPAPYAAYLAWGDHAILSASPELFYETTGRQIRTQPIKGTRPRSSSPTLDAALRADLLASPKDRAELTMIVDLERNDLGRVCEFGSVRVIDPRSVASYSHVHHTVATVAGQLRANVGPVDVVRALFPGGSITGAPKIRAMEIIDELEPARRGIYTGAIGYWSANGRSAFNIAIRTLVVAGSRISYHVGGGIVIDSDPEQEYQETLAKGRALFACLTDPGAAS